MAQVGVSSDAELILPTFPPRSTTSVSIAGAGNEFLPFQLVVAGACTVTNVSVAPFGPFGAGDIRCFTVFNVTLTQRTAADGWTGPTPCVMWPIGPDDVLGESRSGGLPLIVQGGQVQSFWIDLHVPQGASAGTYQGTAVVSIDGQGPTSVPLTVVVYGFSLPSTSRLRSFAPVYYSDLIVQHSAISVNTQTAFNQLRTLYSQLALDHRYSLSGVDTGDATLGGWTGNFQQFCDGTSNQTLNGAKWTTISHQTGSGDTTLSNDLGSWSAWLNQIVSTGGLSRLFAWTADEPPHTSWGAICPRNQAVKNTNSQAKTLVTTDIGSATSNHVQNCVDILCPIIESIDPIGSGQTGRMADYASWLGQGSVPREVWTYQSCDEYQAGWLRYTHDSKALQMRQMQWMEYLLGVSGELYFCATYSYSGVGGNQWNGANLFVFGGNGGTWFFPGCAQTSPTGSPLIGGQHDIPLASFLLKQIRQGMQDYEYGKILDSFGDNTMRTLGGQMFPSIAAQPSIDTFLQNRLAIGQRANQLAGNAAPTPAPTVSLVAPSSGSTAGGDSVTISGSNFATGDTVTFGAQPASIVNVSSGAIVCLTPTNPAGTVNVTVANPNGQSSTLVNGFTYNAAIPAKPSGPPLDPGYPVAASCTALLTSTLSVTSPSATPSGTGGRLVYAVVVWNTRSNANATGVSNTSPVVSDSNGNTFTLIASGDFGSGGGDPTPFHQGAEIHARWYTGPVPSGTRFTITFGGTCSFDMIFAVYSRYNTVSGAVSVANCFGSTAQANDPFGASGNLSVTLTSVSATSGAVVAVEDGSGAATVSPLSNTVMDVRSPSFIAQIIGSLVGTPGSSVTLGGSGAGLFYNVVAAEILAGSPSVAPTVISVSPTSVGSTGGDTVTVGGTGFQNGATVSVQNGAVGIQCSTTYVSAFQVTFVTPAHSAGLVDVVVTNPDSQSGRLSAGLAFASSAPAIQTTTPSNVSPKGTGSALNRTRTIYRLQGTQDATLNRLQDQLAGAVNPVASAVGEMPVAKSGVFQAENWTNMKLVNAWDVPPSLILAPTTPPGYYKDATGRVTLRGVVFDGQLGTVAAVLPLGYRPGQDFVVPTAASAPSAAAVLSTVKIGADGGVTPTSGDATKGIALDGISFRAEG